MHVTPLFITPLLPSLHSHPLTLQFHTRSLSSLGVRTFVVSLFTTSPELTMISSRLGELGISEMSTATWDVMMLAQETLESGPYIFLAIWTLLIAYVVLFSPSVVRMLQPRAERADELAKSAASGASSASRLLPRFLRKQPLPHSIPAIRHIHLTQLCRSWKRRWKKSPRPLLYWLVLVPLPHRTPPADIDLNASKGVTSAFTSASLFLATFSLSLLTQIDA